MEQTRRQCLAAATALVATDGVRITAAQRIGGTMCGLIGKITAVGGQFRMAPRIPKALRATWILVVVQLQWLPIRAWSAWSSWYRFQELDRGA